MTVESKQVDMFEKTDAQLTALVTEIGSLSKSKPDNPLNKFKIRFINQALAQANTLLDDQHRPIDGFEQFTEELLPSYSDVLIVLTQYVSALEGWRSANAIKVGYNWQWNIKGNRARSTEPPTRFRRGIDDE